MSGQLVGEVLAASDQLRARGLSERGFHALVAIAEKASVHDRTASVRWDHVRAGLYGASKRTAERAVDDAKRIGVIELIRPGFRNQHDARAPVYRVAPLLLDTDIQVSVSNSEDRDTQVSVSARVDTDKSELDTDNQVSYLTFPSDVSGDGGPARYQFGPRCPKHINDPNPPNCIGCRDAREAAEALAADAERRAEAQHAEIRHAIDDCDDCDTYGRDIYDPNVDCPRHPNFRTTVVVA